VRLPVNTQHPAWGYKNSIECLNASVLKTMLEEQNGNSHCSDKVSLWFH